jgi:acetyltransferase
MSSRGFDSIFSPRSIAVVGASDQRQSVGGAVFANLKSAGFLGPLFAVNQKHDFVQGGHAYRSINDLPEVPDLVVICTPAATVPAIVRESGRRGVTGMVVISAGFREAGPSGRDLENELLNARREFPNLRFIGPNCLGILRPASRLNASFSPVMPLPGRVTFLSQSGALCTAILDWSIEREIGFATCVSVGNMADVGMGDLIDYFADDDQTEALLLYIEGLDNAAHFLTAARACSLKKPVIAYKAGRFAESSKAAASHTGALASFDAIYDVAFRHAGVERVNSIEELFDCANLLVGQNPPTGRRLAIVTNAGGPGVMASDSWLALGGTLSTLSDETTASLNKLLPPCWSHGNPIDVLGDASHERYQTAIGLALRDPNVDALLVILTPQTMTEPARVAEVVVAARRETLKPVVTAWIGGPAVQSGRTVLRDAAVPVYDFPEGAANALSHLVSTGQMRLMASHDLASPSQTVPQTCPAIEFPLANDHVVRWRSDLAETNGLLGEVRSKRLFADFGIPTVTTSVAHSADEAASLAESLGYPVVLKILSPDISHKTDVGGVILNLASADAVRASFATMMNCVGERVPNAKIEGVAIQRMISATRGIELLLGMTRDRQFGPVLLLGAGGVTAELQKDSVLELAPFDDHAIDLMLRSLRLFPLLEGYRGRPGVNLPQLRSVVARFARMAEELPEISVAEINPLLATADDVIALDARVISSGISHQ